MNETINNSIKEQINIVQKEDPFKKIFVAYSSNTQAEACNRFLLEQGEPLLNVQVGSTFQLFYSMIMDHCDKSAIRFISISESKNIFFELLEKNRWSYFESLREFSSIRHYLFRSIQDLRANVDVSNYSLLARHISSGGAELAKLLTLYEKNLGNALDFNKGLRILQSIIAQYNLPTLILEKGLFKKLPALEKKLLLLFNLICIDSDDFAEKSRKPETDIVIQSSYNAKCEIRDTFREILNLKQPLSSSVIIIPPNMLSLTIEQATQLQIPFYSDGYQLNESKALKVFRALLEIIESGFAYNEIRLFLLLQGRIAQLKQLAKAGMPAGYDAIAKKLREHIKHTKDRKKTKGNVSNDTHAYKNSAEHLLESLNQIQEIHQQNLISPHAKGLMLLESIIKNPQDRNLIESILQQNNWLEEIDDFARWSQEIRNLFNSIHASPEQSTTSKHGIFITTRLSPGPFDYIYMCGLQEGSFPPVFREDPFLIDEARDALNDEFASNLITRKEHIQQFEKDFYSTIYAARKKWCGSFSRFSTLDNKPQTPSFYLIDIARQSRGGKIDQNEYLEMLTNNSRPFMDSEAQALDYNEWVIQKLFSGNKASNQELIAYMCHTHPSVQKHLESDKNIWQDKFGPYTGWTGIDALNLYGNKFSASELSSMISCPRSWFLGYLLKLKTFEEPIELRIIDRKDLGTIVHKIFEEYFSKNKGKSTLKEMLEIAGSEIEDWANPSGGIPNLFRDITIDILQPMIENFLEFQRNLPYDRKPSQFEYAFHDYHSGPDKKNAPVELNFGDLSIVVKGFIDRIDFSSNKAWILDYKTGKSYHKIYTEGAHIAEFLQAGIYAAVVDAVFAKQKNLKEIETGYFYVKDSASESIKKYDETMKNQLSEVIEFCVSSLKNGFHFAKPGNCDYCDHISYCGTIISYSAQRQLEARADQKLKPLLSSHALMTGELK